MAGLTQPLELKRFIRIAPKSGFDCVPFIDVILIAVFISLNISAFVILPGISVELPQTRSFAAMEGDFTGVLTVDRNAAFFFEGKKVSPSGLEDQLRQFVDESRIEGVTAPRITLLIKSDASVSASYLMELMEMAQSAGFAKVHLASESIPINRPENWKSLTLPGE